MIDLTSKSVDEINELISKYKTILELFISQQNHIPYLAYIIDKSLNHINDVHNELNADWKTWAILVIKNQYFNDGIKTDDDVINNINDFIKYYDENYQNYCESLVMSATDFDRDYEFILTYLK